MQVAATDPETTVEVSETQWRDRFGVEAHMTWEATPARVSALVPNDQCAGNRLSVIVDRRHLGPVSSVVGAGVGVGAGADSGAGAGTVDAAGAAVVAAVVAAGARIEVARRLEEIEWDSVDLDLGHVDRWNLDLPKRMMVKDESVGWTDHLCREGRRGAEWSPPYEQDVGIRQWVDTEGGWRRMDVLNVRKGDMVGTRVEV